MIWACGERGVAQKRGADSSLSLAGHGMEVGGPEAVWVRTTQGDTEHAVVPGEADTLRNKSSN